MTATIAHCLRTFDPETLAADDFLITNDPYHGGQHLNDIFIFSPILLEGRLLGFAATVAHHIDVGGGAPGLNMAARELLQEGLVIPPSRWNAGRLERRPPTAADRRRTSASPSSRSAISTRSSPANAIGAKRVQALCAVSSGPDTVAKRWTSSIRYGERRMRAAIRGCRTASIAGRIVIDDDGAGGGPVAIRCAMTVVGEEIAIDFVGTDPQVGDEHELPLRVDPVGELFLRKRRADRIRRRPSTPAASRPITIDAPLGTIVNPRPPSAGARTHDGGEPRLRRGDEGSCARPPSQAARSRPASTPPPALI